MRPRPSCSNNEKSCARIGNPRPRGRLPGPQRDRTAAIRPPLDDHGARTGPSLRSCACRVARSSVALGFRYVERALFARHSFAEIKRMHGQKPLWSPGAWQEYLSAAWLPARCPHVHISRASSGEPPAGRPRTPTIGFACCKFLLVTVPRSLCTLAPYLRPGDFVPLSFASAQADVHALGPGEAQISSAAFERDEPILVCASVAGTTTPSSGAERPNPLKCEAAPRSRGANPRVALFRTASVQTSAILARSSPPSSLSSLILLPASWIPARESRCGSPFPHRGGSGCPN